MAGKAGNSNDDTKSVDTGEGTGQNVSGPSVTHSSPTIVTVKKHLSRRKLLGIVLVVLIVAGLGLTAWSVFGNGSNDDPDASLTPAQKQQKQNKEVVKSAVDANGQNDFKKEASELQAYMDTNPPAEFASKEIIRMATAYANAGDYDKAIQAYETSLQKYPENKLAVLRGLGFTYMVRGDKNNGNKDDYHKALDYFKQAVALELSDPNTAYLAGSDNNNISMLEAKLQ